MAVKMTRIWNHTDLTARWLPTGRRRWLMTRLTCTMMKDNYSARSWGHYQLWWGGNNAAHSWGRYPLWRDDNDTAHGWNHYQLWWSDNDTAHSWLGIVINYGEVIMTQLTARDERYLYPSKLRQWAMNLQNLQHRETIILLKSVNTVVVTKMHCSDTGYPITRPSL